ncbi:hypothetical protein ARMSODRAFT_968563 [Armillaria solidipes]|uniref:Uncharacterized protein n=1 Tax=Armillaria solidipes TaxID=1076256 RepID=A0A2H3CNV2_9AGAR|nr:hypothetical protein ARMSODRAFT_968563 [Armillaria solidipes]
MSSTRTDPSSEIIPKAVTSWEQRRWRATKRAPGHQDISGNEEADALVKEASHIRKRKEKDARTSTEEMGTGVGKDKPYWPLWTRKLTQTTAKTNLEVQGDHIGEFYELFNIPEILRERSRNLVMCGLWGTTEGIEAVSGVWNLHKDQARGGNAALGK